MAHLSGTDDDVLALLDALKLPKHTKWFSIHFSYDSIVTIECEYYAEKDGIKELEPILSKYRLEKIEEGEEGNEHQRTDT